MAQQTSQVLCVVLLADAVLHTASGATVGVKDAAFHDAADMIANANAKARASSGPGSSVLHEVGLLQYSATIPLPRLHKLCGGLHNVQPIISDDAVTMSSRLSRRYLVEV